MQRRLFKRSTRFVSARNVAVMAAALAHLAGLAVLAFSTGRTDRAEFIGQETIELSARWTRQEPLQPPPAIQVDELLSSSEVVVMPRRAEMARRRFLRVEGGQFSPEPVTGQDAVERVFPRAEANPEPQLQRRESARPVRAPNAVSPNLVRRWATLEVMTEVPIPPSIGRKAKTPPDLSRNPPPTYPAVARQRGWQGVVWLRLEIDASGRVSKVTVAKSSGHDVLDGAAVNAVKRWKARPAERRGRPVPTVEVLPIRFRL